MKILKFKAGFILILFGVLSLNSIAQDNKQKVAIYVAKNNSTEPTQNQKMQQYSKFFANELQLAVSHSVKFDAVERTGKFLALLSKEQAYQRSGQVDDKKIAELGKQEGVDFVLSVELMDMGNNAVYVVWKMINVETAIVPDGDSELKTIKNMVEDLKEVSANITKRITGKSVSKMIDDRKHIWSEDDLKKAGFLFDEDVQELKIIDGVCGPALTTKYSDEKYKTTYKYGKVINEKLNGLVLFYSPPIPNKTAGEYTIAYCVNGKVAIPSITVAEPPLLETWNNGVKVKTPYDEFQNQLIIDLQVTSRFVDLTELDESNVPILEYLYSIFGKDITKFSFYRAFQQGIVDMEILERNFDKFIMNGEKIPAHVWVDDFK